MPTIAANRRKPAAPVRAAAARSAKPAPSRRKPAAKKKKKLDPVREQQAQDYSDLRRKRGTKDEVAAKLGIDRSTLFRRETGDLPVDREAILALKSLTVKAHSSAN